MRKKVEILAPAGSFECFEAALKAGADAVYLGGSSFGARAYADNFTEEKLLETIRYAHLHGRKIYLTVNTLLKEKELEEQLYSYLLPYYRQGLDAVIVQDVGVLEFIREYFPDLPIHASTQMTVTNVSGAKFLENQGVERVVPAREISLEEIKEIHDGTGLEVECFVHGALCYCYSGQCLLSSLIGQRSGNRGQCAQPCRLPYSTDNLKNPSYLMSLKDICTLDLIPDLIDAGVDSFKIEGRMKKPEYVALVTKMYRRYADLYLEKGRSSYVVDDVDRQHLLDLYNRGGSHEGYYRQHNGADMVSKDRPNHAGVPALQVAKAGGRSVLVKALTEIHKGDVVELPDGKENYTFGQDVKTGASFSFVSRKNQNLKKGQILSRTRNEALLTEVKSSVSDTLLKEPVDGELILSKGGASVFRLTCGGVSAEAKGEPAQEAVSQPLTSDRIEKQIRKFGNTAFELKNLHIDMNEELFIPMQNLNELRREAVKSLEEKIAEQYKRTSEKAFRITDESGKVNEKNTGVTQIFVYAEQIKQAEAVLKFPEIGRIYLDCTAIEGAWKNKEQSGFVKKVHEQGKEIYFVMPYIFRKDTKEKYQKNLTGFLDNGYDGFLIRNFESYMFLKENGVDKPVVLDFGLYQFNRYAAEFWKRQGAVLLSAPLELNERELAQAGMEGKELMVYGRIPVMISAQCMVKTTGKCTHRQGITKIKDRMQKEFVVKNCCDYCYNVMYNCAPTVLLDDREAIERLHPEALRLVFTTEDERQTADVAKMYIDTFLKGKTNIVYQGDFTRGHFRRGIK